MYDTLKYFSSMYLNWSDKKILLDIIAQKHKSAFNTTTVIFAVQTGDTQFNIIPESGISKIHY